MRVLIACEFSGTVREAFRKKGHDAWSCDIIPSDDNSLYHYQCDVVEVLNRDWDMIIAHPPCTRLCNSGVMWLDRRDLWEDMREGARFFKQFLDHPCKKIAIENPIMHKYAVEIIGRRQDQVVQPWQFGHGETKATCFWLKGLPLLQPTKIVEGRVQRLHLLPPSKDRAKIRSKTFQGIASAMADQWGTLKGSEE
jgi:hypothetical protein